MCNVYFCEFTNDCAICGKFLSICMCNVNISKFTLNSIVYGKLLSICASDGGFNDLTLDGRVGFKNLGLCVSNAYVCELTYDCAICGKFLSICMCNVNISKFAINCIVYGKILNVCASNVNISKSALYCSCLGSGDLFSSCKCELSELGKLGFCIGDRHFICASHIENRKSALGRFNLLGLLSICRSNLKVRKSALGRFNAARCHSIGTSGLNRSERAFYRRNLGKILDISAGNSSFNDLALDGRVGFKNLRLCASDRGIGKSALNRSNLSCLNSVCAGDIRFCYLAINSLNSLNTDFVGTGDICIRKSALGSFSCGENLSISASEIKGSKLTYLVTAFGLGYLLSSCKSELSKSGKVGCSICGSDLICLSKVSIGNSALGRLNISKLLSLGTSNSGFNDLALDGRIGFKNLGLCASEINACESAINRSNLVCLACISKDGLIRNNCICMSKLNFCIVTVLGLSSLRSLFICVSKLYLRKVKGYCRGSFLNYLRKICLNNQRKIVVLDDLRHITVVILLLGLSLGLGFYIIINNICVCERRFGSFCNGRLCYLILIISVIVAYGKNVCSLFFGNLFYGNACDIIVIDDYNVCNDNSCTGSNLCNDGFYVFILGNLLSGSFSYRSIGYGSFLGLGGFHLHKRNGNRNSARNFNLGRLLGLDTGDYLSRVSILKDKRCSGTKAVLNVGRDPILETCAALDEVFDLLNSNLTLLAHVNSTCGKVSGDSRVKLRLRILGLTGNNSYAINVLIDSGIETEGLVGFIRRSFSVGIVIACNNRCLILCSVLAIVLLIYGSGNYVDRIEHRTFNSLVLSCETIKFFIEGRLVDHIDLGINRLLSLLGFNLLGLCLLSGSLCYGSGCRLGCLTLTIKVLLDEIVEGTSNGSCSFYSLKLGYRLGPSLGLFLGLGHSLSLSHRHSFSLRHGNRTSLLYLFSLRHGNGTSLLYLFSLRLGNGTSLLYLFSLLSCIVDR